MVPSLASSGILPDQSGIITRGRFVDLVATFSTLLGAKLGAKHSTLKL
jgi:hypothetical protein